MAVEIWLQEDGHIEVSVRPKVLPHFSFDFVSWKKIAHHEDGKGNHRYGDRNDQWGSATQSPKNYYTDCEYHATDTPGIKNMTAQAFPLSIFLVFRGRIVDVCNNEKVVGPKRTWGMSTNYAKSLQEVKEGDWGWD